MDSSSPSSSTDGKSDQLAEGEPDSPSLLPGEISNVSRANETISSRQGHEATAIPGSSSAKKHQASSSPPSSSSSIESAKRQKSEPTVEQADSHQVTHSVSNSLSSTSKNVIEEASTTSSNLRNIISSSVSSSICHEEPSRSDDKAFTRSPNAPDSPGPSSGIGHFFPGSFGSVAASPPKFMALDEIMKAANGVANMYLAHEIALNRDFRLPDRSADEMCASSSSSQSQPQQTLQNAIKAAMKKAYWDILQSQLEETPPKYKQALAILEEIKGKLTALLLPQHNRLRQEMDDILDIELIKQQVENGALDFPRYGQYILSVMARLCAPIRDEKIRQLTQTADVVTLFR